MIFFGFEVFSGFVVFVNQPCLMGELAGGGSVAVAVGGSDR